MGIHTLTGSGVVNWQELLVSTAVANQTAVVSVGLPVEPTDRTRTEIGNPGTVWIADALRATADHTTDSVGTTIDVVTGRCNQKSIYKQTSSNLCQINAHKVYNCTSWIGLKNNVLKRLCLGGKKSNLWTHTACKGDSFAYNGNLQEKHSDVGLLFKPCTSRFCYSFTIYGYKD